MDLVLRRGNLGTSRADLIAVGIAQDATTLRAAPLAVDRATGGAITALLRSRDFQGAALETALLHPRGRAARRVLVVGLGPVADLDLNLLRQFAGAAARRARDLGLATLALDVPGLDRGLDPERIVQALAEGAQLGNYRHTVYRSDPGPVSLRRAELVAADARVARLEAAVTRGERWAAGVCLARDLASTPGDDLTPEKLADAARGVAKRSGARTRVLGVAEMERLGMGALLAVGRGSIHPPRFVVLERGPATSRRTVVLIGKGVTFDTGGISIKPREGMAKMKYDMSGAAAVLGTFLALPALELPFRVVGLVPTAENMPSDRAFKPGDVVRAMNGTTIEITNTDAEGRLILADALCYARRFEPEAVVDLATLTGAISIALGRAAAGLFSPDEPLASALLAASAAAGERLWRMPLYPEYGAELKSDTADLVNSAVKEGGACIAAAFLERFARGMSWAHLDIASTAWAYSERPLESRGPNGFGVRLLLEWLAARARAG